MRALITVILIGIAFVVHAQKDKVYLKNGSLIRGAIADTTPGDTLKILIEGADILLPLSLVEEIRFKKREKGRPEKYTDLFYQQGFYRTLRVGAILGNHSNYDPLKSTFLGEVAYEYHYHPLINFGIGMGINGYSRYAVAPLYLHYQAMFGKKRKSFFLYGQAGYGFVLAQKEENTEIDDVKNGALYAYGIGLQKKIGNNLIQYKLGYQGQKVMEITSPEDWIWGWTVPVNERVTRIRNMNRIVFSVSYSIFGNRK